MTEDSLAVTDIEGKPLSDRRASSELAMHLLIIVSDRCESSFVTRIRHMGPLLRWLAWQSISQY